jgi:3-isopropylmalate/(R)-2-methylmalate dehydratase large subunit
MRLLPIVDTDARLQFEALAKNCAETGVRLFDMNSQASGDRTYYRAGVGNYAARGRLIVCGDSHTQRMGRFGTLGVLASGPAKWNMCWRRNVCGPVAVEDLHIVVNGERPKGVTAKDIILAIIGKIGISGGNSHVAEYAAGVIRSLSMDGRMNRVQHDD